MACLWVAVEERRRDLLLYGALGLIGSFLAKALTGYVFYGVLGLVLLWRHRNRGFLFTPWSLAIHGAALAAPLVWNYAIAGDSVISPMVSQILYQMKNVDAPNIGMYLMLLVVYPFRTFWYLLPVSAIALYCLWSRRFATAELRLNAVQIALLTLAVNVLPYWMFPGSSTRYIMPLYPLFALLMAYIVLKSGPLIIDFCCKALIATVGVAYVAALVGFPLYEHYIRGNYAKAAQAIVARAGSFPLFAADFSSVGQCIVANLNAQRAPTPPVTTPPAQFASGFVLTDRPDPSIGQVAMTFGLGRNADGKRTRYLLCRGDACSGAALSATERLSF
jgi:hypothetical protein